MRKFVWLVVILISLIGLISIVGCTPPLAINDHGSEIRSRTSVLYKPGARVDEGVLIQDRLVLDMLKMDMSLMRCDCVPWVVSAMAPMGYRYLTAAEVPPGLIFKRGKGACSVAGLP
jgi:hypothetical protein